MRPNFALNLSHDGIVLLHRSARGNWSEVGAVTLDEAQFSDSLSFLRSTAVALDGKGFGTKLIIPDSQILYRTVEAPGPYEDQRIEQIKEALVGETPYEVADLSFDWRENNGQIQVAIVANETLDEAEGFAIDHRFNPLSFTAKYADDNGTWEPFFGRTDYAVSMLGPDADVRDLPDEDAEISLDPTESDDDLIYLGQDDDEEFDDDDAETVDVFERYAIKSSADPEDQPEPDTSPDVTEDTAQTAPSFSSRRNIVLASEPDSATRPIARIAPRIVLSDQDKADKRTFEGLPVEDFVDPINSGEDTQSDRTRVLATLSNSIKHVIAVALLTMLGAMLSLWEARPRRRKPAIPVTVEPIAPPDPTEVSTKAPTVAPSLDSKDENIGGLLGRIGRKRNAFAYPPKFLFAAFGVLAGIAFIVGILIITRPDGMPNDQAEVTNASLDTGDRGVNPDNRAQARPVDLETSTTSVVAPSPSDLASARPVPRSIFEDGTDPDIGLPDTVAPITDLSDEERQDIRDAGMPEPTVEEMAEGSVTVADEPLLTSTEIAELYSKDGVLQGVQSLVLLDFDTQRDDIFVAALDRKLNLNDAVALPVIENSRADLPLSLVVSPLGPQVTFDLDERGLVKATKSGAYAPSGILVFSGKPAIIPPEKPVREILIPLSDLAEVRPTHRPPELKTGEDAIFVQGRLTLSQLKKKKPKERPKSEQILLAAEDETATELAVLTSKQPTKRPANFDQTVEKAKAILVAATAADAPAPSNALIIPTRASVAKLATTTNAIDRGRLNLIGVYGTPSKRRALLRLPSGMYVKVEIGDRIDGGRVASISENSLNYLKSGRNRVLKIPN